MKYTDLPWRVGTKTRRTIYAVLPDVTEDTHPLLGMMDTPELALNAVDTHNESLERMASRSQGLSSYSFAEKEQLIVDLSATLHMWQIKPNLEEAILNAAATSTARQSKVYQMLGIASDILGPQAGIPEVVDRAIKIIKEN